jgi:hypothetical protein
MLLKQQEGVTFLWKIMMSSKNYLLRVLLQRLLMLHHPIHILVGCRNAGIAMGRHSIIGAEGTFVRRTFASTRNTLLVLHQQEAAGYRVISLSLYIY